MNVLVVGAGEMGRWLAAHFEDVAFADADPGTARAAADALDARVATPDERFDCVAFAVPMGALAAAAAEHAHRGDRAVVDVTGEMVDAVATLREYAPDRERVSLHPLFAAANAPGNVAVVADAPGPATEEVLAALEAAGNDPFETTAEEHDRAMETVQARAHVAVLAFALAAEDVPDRFHTPLSGSLADLVEQMTGNEPRVYADVQATFDGAEDVVEAARRLADADPETFRRLYEEATGCEEATE